MARLNSVFLLGKVVNEKLEPRFIAKEKTDGIKGSAVVNFLIECYDEADQRFYKLPVAVWGAEEVLQCEEYLKQGDLVLVQGELRYKFFKNLETKAVEKIYTTVKAKSVEFISKKLKNECFTHFMNEVKLIGNLVHDPIVSEKGFVVAIDRLYPTKHATAPNDELTDFVTLVCKDRERIKGDLKKGSVVIIDGKLMTRKRDLTGAVIPTVVVDVKKIVGR